MTIYFSLLVALIGLIIYVTVKSNGELKEIGRIMFWTGLLTFLLGYPGHALTLPR